MLEALRLSDNNLTHACMKALSEVLCGSKNLKILSLNRNKIGDRGVKLLCETLKDSMCRLEFLGLAQNNLTDESGELLCSTLSLNRSLQTLQVAENQFTDKSANSFLQLINACSSLAEIELQKNKFSSEGMKQLESARQGRPKLKLLV
nr:PREDICTED: ribonuclease inhibitor-like [Latimeria chalumnae]|eukprot:XP_006014443.1 PREDICTED: ribonuclease inhibitor-like [Latimeria chalumnae]